MSAFLTADFVDLYSLYSDWPENAGSRWQPRFPAVFELFPCATSRLSENFFIKKMHIGKKASFHFIVKTEKKNTKTQVIRALKAESQDMAIFDLAFDMT